MRNCPFCGGIPEIEPVEGEVGRARPQETRNGEVKIIAYVPYILRCKCGISWHEDTVYDLTDPEHPKCLMNGKKKLEDRWNGREKK